MPGLNHQKAGGPELYRPSEGLAPTFAVETWRKAEIAFLISLCHNQSISIASVYLPACVHT